MLVLGRLRFFFFFILLFFFFLLFPFYHVAGRHLPPPVVFACVGRTKFFFLHFFILLGFLVERPKSADHDRTELDSCVCVGRFTLLGRSTV